jgi:DNA modification methylase
MDYKEDLKIKLHELKKIEGYPLGNDEDILALSKPPYYTACPNPYIEEFIKQHGKSYDEETDKYFREPFSGDVSEGKNDPIYNVHSYHTKVPPKAIEKFIKHYTYEGDIVLDGFCGTGMTGIAASKLNRYAIISDLSPIATFIAYSLNNPNNISSLKKELSVIIKELEHECGWLYQTEIDPKYVKDESGEQLNLDGNNIRKGNINYVVWSDVLICPFCRQEYVFWKVAIDSELGKVKDEFECPNCTANISKANSEAVRLKSYDKYLNRDIITTKQIPVLIVYTAKVQEDGKWKNKRFQKLPNEYDLNLIQEIESLEIPYWFPIAELPYGYNTEQPKRSHGFSNVHLFYTKRNLWCLAALYHKILQSPNGLLLFLFTSILNRSTQMNRIHLKNYFFGGGGWNAGYLKGTLYVSSLPIETSIFEQLESRVKTFLSAFNTTLNSQKKVIIQTCSVTNLNLPSNSIDYIFTDPPFGSNIMYSELNFIWESWLKVVTNNLSEAIINNAQQKDFDSYKQSMLGAFKEYFRVLKPKRWITIEFNNSSSSIWNLIQDSVLKSGFIVGQVSVLDKKQGSFKQVTSSNSVKSDLIISAFKPSLSFTERFTSKAGVNLEASFINEFLSNLPSKPIIVRTEKMLYSKMLAYYIQRGYEIRYDAKSFYSLLIQNFVQEDGFWFTANQISAFMEYKKKMKLEGINEVIAGGLFLFVTDEKSAIVWLIHFLTVPKTFSDISLAFNQLANIQGDNIPELRELLEQNFIFDDDKYRRPKSEPEHNQISDKREKALLREFESLLIKAKTEKTKIKLVRKEALLFGFETCYKSRRYQDILIITNKLDKAIIENSSELNDFVEAAEIMIKGME